MEFNVGAFNELLGGLGEFFAWRRASACPCLNPASGSPLRNCPRCSGKGRIWAPEVRAQAGVASSKVQLEWSKFGQWESGDMILSIPEDSPLYEISMYDRVTAETSTDAFSIALIRGAANERIHGKIKSIDQVFWYDDDGETTVPGGIPTISTNGVPTWSANAPPDGRAYSISGVKFTEYYCYGPFSNDRMKHAGMRLPRRMVLRKFDLLGRNGAD